MMRTLAVRLHRWLGLATAGFIIIVAVTGSVLSYRIELERWLAPEFYPRHDGLPRLDAATLARRAEAAAPGARAIKVNFGPDNRASFVTLEPGDGTHQIGFDTVYLDVRSGDVIAYADRKRLSANPMSIMEFIYRFHWSFAGGDSGEFVLGLVALAWTIDCVIALLVAIPEPKATARKRYAERLARVFRIQRGGTPFRLLFDLHRAGGLWLWLILFMFAWSSVYMDLNPFYANTMRIVSDYKQPIDKVQPPAETLLALPNMGWEQAQSTGEQLMADVVRQRHFTVERQDAVYLLRSRGLIVYRVRSSLDVGTRRGWTEILFDDKTGELRDVVLPTTQHSGNTITTWLVQLHMADLFGPAYQAVEAILGVALAILSGTGVWIWHRKARARARLKYQRGLVVAGRSDRRTDFVVLSAALHIAACAALAGSMRPALRPPAEQVVEMLFTEAEAPVAATTTPVEAAPEVASAAVEPPVEEKVPEEQVAPPPPPAEDMPEPPTPAPAPRPAPPRPPVHRPPTRAAEARPQPWPVAAGVAPAPAAIQASVPSVFDSEWQSHVAGWLASRKTYPEPARVRREEGKVSVQFVVDRSGRVVDVTKLSGSGSDLLDTAALVLVRNATLPPFPASMPQARVVMTITIRYSLR